MQLSVVHIKQVNLEKNNELFVGTNETVHYIQASVRLLRNNPQGGVSLYLGNWIVTTKHVNINIIFKHQFITSLF